MNKMFQFFKKHKYIYSIIILVVIGGGYYWYNQKNSSNTVVNYKTSPAKKGDMTVSVDGSGNVIVEKSANIDPTITGTVANLAVSVGDSVKKGDFLFNIVNDDLGISASKALASYNSAVISKKQAKEDYSEAKDKERHDSSSYSESELNILKEKVRLAENQVANAWADYLSAKDDADERIVTASIDGTINAINIENGDDLGKNTDSDSEAPIVIGDLSTLKTQVSINEVDISDVKIGQDVKLTFSAIDDLAISGKVEKVDSLGSSGESVVTYDVTISFNEIDSRLKPGMSVSASIITESKKDIITVSSMAVKTQDNKNFVQVMKNGIPSAIQVETGISDGINTEIISGLNVGDEVITNSSLTTTTSSSSSKSNGGGMGMIMGGGGPR